MIYKWYFFITASIITGERGFCESGSCARMVKWQKPAEIYDGGMRTGIAIRK
jgi:hypothetical protein